MGVNIQFIRQKDNTICNAFNWHTTSGREDTALFSFLDGNKICIALADYKKNKNIVYETSFESGSFPVLHNFEGNDLILAYTTSDGQILFVRKIGTFDALKHHFDTTPFAQFSFSDTILYFNGQSDIDLYPQSICEYKGSMQLLYRDYRTSKLYLHASLGTPDHLIDLDEKNIGKASIISQHDCIVITWKGLDNRINVRWSEKEKPREWNTENKHTLPDDTRSDGHPVLAKSRGDVLYIIYTHQFKGLKVYMARNSFDFANQNVRYLRKDMPTSVDCGFVTVQNRACFIFGEPGKLGLVNYDDVLLLTNTTGADISFEGPLEVALDILRDSTARLSLHKGKIDKAPLLALFNDQYIVNVLTHGGDTGERTSSGTNCLAIPGTDKLLVTWPSKSTSPTLNVVQYDCRLQEVIPSSKVTNPNIVSNNQIKLAVDTSGTTTTFYAAGTSMDNQLMILTSTDGLNWSIRKTFLPAENMSTSHPPAIVVTRDYIVIAMRLPDGRIKTVLLNKSNFSGAAAAITEERTDHEMGLMLVSGKYYLAWTGLDQHINIMKSVNGYDWTDKVTTAFKAHAGISIAAKTNGDMAVGFMSIESDKAYFCTIRPVAGLGWTLGRKDLMYGSDWTNKLGTPVICFSNPSNALHLTWCHAEVVQIGVDVNSPRLLRKNFATDDSYFVSGSDSVGVGDITNIKACHELIIFSNCSVASNRSMANQFFLKGTKFFLGFPQVMPEDVCAKFVKRFYERFEKGTLTIQDVLNGIDKNDSGVVEDNFPWVLYENSNAF